MYLFCLWLAQHLLVWKIALNVKLALEVPETKSAPLMSPLIPSNIIANFKMIRNKLQAGRHKEVPSRLRLTSGSDLEPFL